MNNLKHILKIESNNKTVLFSKNAKQQIIPIEFGKLKRNLNLDVIPLNRNFKYKCIIETNDSLNFSAFDTNSKFLIHSIATIQETGGKKPSIPFVSDSVIKKDEYIEYCPIFSMFLTNFKYMSSENKWFLEFEET